MDHFKQYVQKVVKGSKHISGATLLPSTLVDKARKIGVCLFGPLPKNMEAVEAATEAEMM